MHTLEVWNATLRNLNITQDKLASSSQSRRKQCVFLAPWLGKMCRVLWFFILFDATRGFPGEGPAQNRNWSIMSANIGSLHASKPWKTWTNDVLALQETRLGRNNCRSAKFEVGSTGRDVFHGELLPGLITSHGIRRTPHGGVAILAPAPLTKPFQPSEDSSGHYKELFNSKRVVACWIQILPATKLLLVNIYAQTAAASDARIHDYNNSLFSKIFEIIAQFGDIPVLLTGDFQDVPASYHAISHAIRYHGWCDPLTVTNPNGEIVRNITFSNDRTFSGEAEGCSSIDGILTNRVATAALQSCAILETFHSQHRPIEATFNWSRIYQTGFVLKQPAPFILPPRSTEEKSADFAERVAESVWNREFAQPFHDTMSIEERWQVANSFCIRTLLSLGAKWGPGECHRGKTPKFLQKKVRQLQVRPKH